MLGISFDLCRWVGRVIFSLKYFSLPILRLWIAFELHVNAGTRKKFVVVVGGAWWVVGVLMLI